MRYTLVFLIFIVMLLSGCLLLDRYTDADGVEQPAPITQGLGAAADRLIAGDWKGALIGGVATTVATLLAAWYASKNKKTTKTLAAVVAGIDDFVELSPSQSPVVSVLHDSLRGRMNAKNKLDVRRVRELDIPLPPPRVFEAPSGE